MSFTSNPSSEEQKLKLLIDSNNILSLNQFIEEHDIEFFFNAKFEQKQLSSKQFSHLITAFSFP
jgi:hypothetical protein